MKFHSHRYGIPTAIGRDKIVIKLLDSIWPIDFTTFPNGDRNYLAKLYVLLLDEYLRTYTYVELQR